MKFLMWLLQYGSDMDEEWNQFESALAKLKLQGIFDENTWLVRENTVESDGYEDNLHGDPFKRAQDYEMYAVAIKEALQMIPELFAQWIRTVKLSKKKISFGWDIICENSPAHHRPDDLFWYLIIQRPWNLYTMCQRTRSAISMESGIVEKS